MIYTLGQTRIDAPSRTPADVSDAYERAWVNVAETYGGPEAFVFRLRRTKQTICSQRVSQHHIDVALLNRAPAYIALVTAPQDRPTATPSWSVTAEGALTCLTAPHGPDAVLSDHLRGSAATA